MPSASMSRRTVTQMKTKAADIGRCNCVTVRPMTTTDALTDQQRQQWSAAALGWERWGDWFDRNSGDLSGWLCDAAAIRPGQRVLGLACGAGALGAPESSRVGQSGHVTGTYLSPDMVEVTKRPVQRVGLTNVDVQ